MLYSVEWQTESRAPVGTGRARGTGAWGSSRRSVPLGRSPSAAAGCLRDLQGISELSGQSSARLEILGAPLGRLREGGSARLAAAAALAKVAASEQREVSWKVLQRDPIAGWGTAGGDGEGDAFGVAESAGLLATPRILPVGHGAMASTWNIFQAGSQAIVSGGLGGKYLHSSEHGCVVNVCCCLLPLENAVSGGNPSR
jgi:hypothetical protein